MASMTEYNGEGFYQTRHFNIFLTASVSECTWDAALRRWERGEEEYVVNKEEAILKEGNRKVQKLRCIFIEKTQCSSLTLFIFHTQAKLFFLYIFFSSRRKIKNCTNGPSKGKRRRRKKWHPT